jgi:hypothetical protein
MDAIGVCCKQRFRGVAYIPLHDLDAAVNDSDG